MMFRRRDPQSTASRLRAAFYPRKGWRRGFDYVLQRVRRLPDTPHNIAFGFAWGTFASFTPLYGLHIPLTLLVTWLGRGNLLAGFIGTFVGNALTTPFIAVAAITTGNILLGREVGAHNFADIARAFAEAFGGLWQIGKSLFGFGEAAPGRLLPFFHDIFLPYMVGGAATGLLAGILAYFACRGIVAAYQMRRRRRLGGANGAGQRTQTLAAPGE
ncbi:MAG TPA: DUF2062 domain-containing protein [Paracoccaceae bacterium]|nr:DUF2062 domain-containing protein [Paracoccaceae bacterium]